MAVVIFSPHVDDEVLGCFGFLGPDTHVVYGGIEDRPSVAVRIAELEASVDALGFSYRVLDQPVNNYDAALLISAFETTINEVRPETVLVPVPSYNQDHRAFFEAAMVATRPHDQNHRVDRVLLYEQPHSILWPMASTNAEPSVFVPIDVEAKVEAYRRYASQVRGHRSEATLRAAAQMRGAAIGVSAAEAFHPRRFILS